MTRRKGISQTIGRLILIVLAVIIVAAFLIGNVKGDLGTWISDFLSGLTSGGGDGYHPTLLEGAIKCAWYRCKGGCDAVADGDFGDFGTNCLALCGEDRDEKNLDEICDSLAKTYPVEITLASDTTVSRVWWQDLWISEYPNVLMQTMIETGSNCDFIPGTGMCTLKLHDSASCTDDVCTLPSGSYYLWAHKGTLSLRITGMSVCPSQYGTEKNVLLFDKKNFKFSQDPVPFKYSDNDLSDNQIGGEASSIRVPDGWRVTLYEGKNSGGKYITVAGDSSTLDLGKKLSSIEILGGSSCYVILCDEEGPTGNCINIHESNSNLKNVLGPCGGNANDCFLSVKVEGGEDCKAILYEHSKYNKILDGGVIAVSGISSSIEFDNTAYSMEIDLPVYDIKVVVSEGGKVDVSKNDELAESITGPSEATIQFAANDKAKFVPEPSSGYVFYSWCGENQIVCCYPQEDDYCTETFERLINADGILYANFASA